MKISRFIVLITLFNMVVYHVPFFKYAISNLSFTTTSGILTLMSLSIALFVVMVFIFHLMASISIKLLKYFTIVMVVGNSIAVYFSLTYNVILDRTMMGNVFNTDFKEATSYYDPKIFLYIFFLGIVPAFLISRIRLLKPKRFKMVLIAFSTLFVGVFLLYLNSGTWLWLDKNSKIMGGLSMPWSYMINPIRYKLRLMKKSQKQILLPDGKLKNDDKMIVVLVIGESARKRNFSLYGYKKDTNPLLEKQNVLVVKDTTSVATYTTASLSCMLSATGSTSDSHEPLSSYLQRQGVDVIWRANNWGEPKMKVKIYQKIEDIKTCQGEKCGYDEGLLSGILDTIKRSDKNKIFVVLHTAGSHGPTYYKKYPKGFEKFKPVCKSVDLKECTNEELINAYDNTILYTDYFLNQTIETFKKIKDFPVVMLYLSDHGESLGEYGLYLHGTPYSIAPDVQKEIPFIIWESDKFMKKKGFSKPEVSARDSYGQYNIFHTVIGAFDLQSSVYNPKLDILKNN